MIKLIAIVYFLVNGQPAGDPVRLANNHLFDTVEDCRSFVDSDAGQDAIEKLNETLQAKLPENVTHTVTTSCEAAVVKDNSI